MKKLLASLLTAIFGLTIVEAQTVTNLGTTTINRTISDYPIGDLTIGNYPSNDADIYHYYRGAYSAQTLLSENFNIAFDGRMVNNTNLSSKRAFGVRGIAGRAHSGYNYGVLGGIEGDNNGSGIFGTISSHTGVYIPGKYAGYFDGATYVAGNLTATAIYTPSDMRLKENVISLNNSSTLDKILDLDVIEYNLQVVNYEADSDTASIEDSPSIKAQKECEMKRRHYGVSAQELQTVYPYLVEEGQNGYLGVNYIELVPILIRSIQELKQELDGLKATYGVATNNTKKGKNVKYIRDRQIVISDK